ncbi:MAG: LytTR family DNA-binding domain-containing protein [Gemmatimonadota bacterium]|nr:LytTR family DNA-binding domain-containing protein [Gemmatimonadota bacterium]
MSDPRPIRVLVVDDEPLGCRRIVNLLRDQPGVELVGTAEDGDAAVEAIRTTAPDLVFLDIQMPRKTGLDVVQEVGPANMPATIFVTAYDQFALRAFDLAAVDYLVKPFDDERFEEAFRRARRKVELEGLERLQAQMRALLGAGAAPVSPPPPAARQYLERITVHMRGKTRVVPVSEIDYITASGVYAELHVGTTSHLIRESMQTLEEQLDPGRFVRIHRSAIVRLELIETLLRAEGGDYQVQLRGGVRLKVSRYRREELERRLGTGRR